MRRAKARQHLLLLLRIEKADKDLGSVLSTAGEATETQQHRKTQRQPSLNGIAPFKNPSIASESTQ